MNTQIPVVDEEKITLQAIMQHSVADFTTLMYKKKVTFSDK